jgi:hypothetical protein
VKGHHVYHKMGAMRACPFGLRSHSRFLRTAITFI